MTELELLQAVRAAAKSLRIRCCYTGSPVTGFPDLVLIGRAVLFRELENGASEVTSVQLECLTELHIAGHDVAIWRPADWPGRIFAELDAIRPL